MLLLELLVVGLRIREGVDLKDFQARHGTLETETKEAIERLQSQDLLCLRGDSLCLTKKGRLFYDSIAVELI